MFCFVFVLFTVFLVFFCGVARKLSGGSLVFSNFLIFWLRLLRRSDFFGRFYLKEEDLQDKGERYWDFVEGTLSCHGKVARDRLCG